MSLPNLPEHVSQALGLFTDAARAAFGDNLRSLVLFGSAAEGKLRATSDVNVLLVLRALDRNQLDTIREPLRAAQAAINLQSMLILEGELADAAEAFANKFEDIRRRHVILAGDDVVNTLTISRDALVRRVRQVLLNQTLRLRDAYAEKSLREEQATAVIADAAGPLRASAAAILELEGRAASDPKSALATLAADSELASVLPHISEARERKLLAPGSAAGVLFDVARLAQWMYERASVLP
jgi:predicted nucleotidyltransferase